MGWSHMVLALAVVLALPQKLSGQSSRINTVAPLTAKVGDTLTATGEGIDKERVDTLYLTDGTHDFKVPILDQTDTVIKFTVPATVKPGRYALMIRTTGSHPQLMEMPVKLTVE